MFRIPAIKEICNEAKLRARKIGVLNKSIRQGKGNYVGCLFEVAHMFLYGGTPSSGQEMFEYDIKMPEGWLKDYGTKLECKTKERTVPDLDPTWEASIADRAGRGVSQKCDSYAFGSVYVNKSKEPVWIWFGGIIKKQEYLEGRDNVGEIQGKELDSRNRQIKRWNNLKTGAEFRLKGLPYDDNHFTCNEDCWNRSYSYLDSYSLKEIPRLYVLRNILNQARREGWGGTNQHLLGVKDGRRTKTRTVS